MPRKNTNARPHRATTILQALPDPAPTHTGAGRSPAEDKLWAALRAHPDTTTTDLAGHAGIGRSTAGKILTTWERDGAATRTDQHHGPPAPDAQHDSPQDTAPPAPAIPPDTDTDNPPENDSDSDSGVDTEPATPEPVQDTDPDAEHSAAPGTRLSKGALRGLVEDYLSEHRDLQFSPSAIGKALGRSSGAVANALDRLVTDGYAIQTQDKPKRYTAAPAAPDTTS